MRIVRFLQEMKLSEYFRDILIFCNYFGETTTVLITGKSYLLCKNIVVRVQFLGFCRDCKGTFAKFIARFLLL